MNRKDLKSNPWLPAALAAGAGLLGLLLRLWLYGTGLEENNLLRASHPALFLLTALTLAFFLAAVLLTKQKRQTVPYAERFPKSALAGIGCFIGALGLLSASLVDLVRRETGLNAAAGLLGVLGAAALVWLGLLRFQGKRPKAAPHAVVCLYFVARLISRYQGWSADPQLQDYCYQLLSIVFLMLYSYHRSALDLSDGSGWAVNALGMMSVYCCFLSLARSDSMWLYLCCLAWVLLSQLPAPRAAAEPLPEADRADVEEVEEAAMPEDEAEEEAEQ